MKHVHIIAANVLVLLLFGILAIVQSNIEFVFYFMVVVLLALLVIKSLSHVEYPKWVLWMLSGWAWAHMAGGLVSVNGSVLYNLMLIPIVGEPYLILKYDQVVHAYGFFVATMVMYYVMQPQLRKKAGTFAIPFIAFLAGMGLGAINELVEFTAVVIIPDTNVGGYINTGVDLVANSIGALIAALYIRYKLL